ATIRTRRGTCGSGWRCGRARWGRFSRRNHPRNDRAPAIERSAVARFPSAVARFPSAVARFPSVVARFSPAVASFPPAVASFPPAVVSFPPAVARFPPAVASFPPAAQTKKPPLGGFRPSEARESLARFLVQSDRLRAVLHHLAGDHAFADRALRGDGVHDLEHQLFDDDLEAASANVAFEGFLGDGFEGVVGEAELDVLEAHDRLILPDERVLRLAEDLDERASIELAQRRHDGQASDELRDQS